MDKKTTGIFVIILALVFVGFGDKFLPKPLSTASYNTRTTLNNSLLGIFPSKKPRNPYERTEKAIEQEEKGGK
ncbi:hypothetical protein NDI37_26975 [Funiculus sociatus GB2-A5]|uniref:Uncharacterized protein n=1 Tax=Funiculus sociatus GB2-A5 TaxID=2933946 RepID=A0ABV0JX91_9CYAN|nr:MULTISPECIES: hypothetical protein [unclassified Trichocoleus]MBD2002809.1 hypothetical protein [Trichocoleus sp. FACHB-40]MBD2061254.1 hypothetical protein [Trichocoleus sp. FACHB-6]